MKKLSSQFGIPLIVISIIAVIVGFLILGGEDLLGISTTDTGDFIYILPGIFAIIVAFFAVKMSEGYMLGAAVAGTGLAFAFLIHLMDDIDLVIPETGVLASDIQLIFIIIFTIVGIMLAVRDR